MKRTPLLIAPILAFCMATSHAELKDYNDLGFIGRMRYDSCMESATSKPTPQGVNMATQACKRKFLEVSDPPSELGMFLAQVARDLNAPNQSLTPPLTSRYVETNGNVMVVIYRGAFNKAQIDRLQSDIHDSTQNDICPIYDKAPLMKKGAVVLVTYLSQTGEEIAKTEVTAPICRRWAQKQR